MYKNVNSIINCFNYIIINTFTFNIAKNNFFYRIPDLVLIHTPKGAHSRIFVTGGSVYSRDKRGA